MHVYPCEFILKHREQEDTKEVGEVLVAKFEQTRLSQDIVLHYRTRTRARARTREKGGVPEIGSGISVL